MFGSIAQGIAGLLLGPTAGRRPMDERRPSGRTAVEEAEHLLNQPEDQDEEERPNIDLSRTGGQGNSTAVPLGGLLGGLVGLADGPEQPAQASNPDEKWRSTVPYSEAVKGLQFPTQGTDTPSADTGPAAPLPTEGLDQQLAVPAATQLTQQPANRYKSQLDKAMDKYYALRDTGATTENRKEFLRSNYDKKKDSALKNVGKGIAHGLGQISSILLNPNIPDDMAWGAAVGGAIGGALGGVINPLADEERAYQADLARSQSELDQAGAAYDSDQQRRLKEANIENIDSQIGERARQTEAKLTAAEAARQRAETGRYNALTARVNSVIRGIKGGVLDRTKTEELESALSDMAGFRVYVPPVDGTVKDVRIETDAEGNRKVRIITFNDGREQVNVIKNPDGTEMTFKPERVKVEEIRGATSIATTGMRTASSERIARARNATSVRIAEMNIDAKEAQSIMDSVDDEMSMMDTDDLIRSTGRDPSTMSPEEYDRVLGAVYLRFAERRINARKAVPKKP